MVDIVFSAENYDILLAAAKDLGFTYKDANGIEHILTSGPMTSGGSYFLNYIGDVFIGDPPKQIPGVWGRLRLNGSESDAPHFPSTITQYKYSSELAGWTSDGITVAPDYVGEIGAIA